MSESDKSFWDKSAKAYAKSKASEQEGYELSLSATKTYLKPADRVLELGCGTGTTAFVLASSVDRYLATDLSSEMIRLANEGRTLHADDEPGLEFRAATAEDVAGDEAKFNAVLGYHYLHLVRDPMATLATIHGMLEDGGVFISKTACVGDMNPLLRWVFLPGMQMMGKASHVSCFTQSELTRMMEKTGFEVVREETHTTKKKNDHRPFIVARKKEANSSW